MGYALIQLMSLRLSQGEAEGESETKELCQAANPRTRYSLSNLYHPGMRGFECVATRGNKKYGLCLYLIHTFVPIVCIKCDVRWYKYRLIIGYRRISRVGWSALHKCRRHECKCRRPTSNFLQYPMINLFIVYRSCACKT